MNDSRSYENINANNLSGIHSKVLRQNGADNTRTASNRWQGNPAYQSAYAQLDEGEQRWNDGWNIIWPITDRKEIITKVNKSLVNKYHDRSRVGASRFPNGGPYGFQANDSAIRPNPV